MSAVVCDRVLWKQRLARTLAKRQKDEDSIRSRVRRSRSFARHHQGDIGADELSYEDWRPASSSYSVRTQPPYALGKPRRLDSAVVFGSYCPVLNFVVAVLSDRLLLLSLLIEPFVLTLLDHPHTAELLHWRPF